MKPGRYDLPDIYRGCDWGYIILIWKDQNGNPIDLSGKMPFAYTNDSVNLNPTIYDAPNGITRMFLDKNATLLLKMGTFRWDWIWWDDYPNGFKYPPFLFGNVIVREPSTDLIPP